MDALELNLLELKQACEKMKESMERYNKSHKENMNVLRKIVNVQEETIKCLDGIK